MVTFKVKLCPFNGDMVVISKPSELDKVPDVGTYILDGTQRFRVALVEAYLDTKQIVIQLHSVQMTALQLKEATKELLDLGWKIETNTKKKDD